MPSDTHKVIFTDFSSVQSDTCWLFIDSYKHQLNNKKQQLESFEKQNANFQEFLTSREREYMACGSFNLVITDSCGT